MNNPFAVGRRYNRRRDIHGRLSGQQQGGMSTPIRVPYVLLFTGETGEVFGYKDEFKPDGMFWYTGEGQSGDMKLKRGNRAIRKNSDDGKELHVFESVDGPMVRYVGEAVYVGHHFERRPDLSGEWRNAIVFELDMFDPSVAGESLDTNEKEAPSLGTKSLEELRKMALSAAPTKATERERRQVTRLRSDSVRLYVLARADGVCEACGKPAPFKTKKGVAYLEPHHIQRLADGGPDHPHWVGAVCPNCHREIHYGQDGQVINSRLEGVVARTEDPG